MKKPNLFLTAFLIMQILFLASARADSKIENYQITANKLDKTRNNLSTQTGTSSYSFDQNDIENSALGSVTSLNKLSHCRKSTLKIPYIFSRKFATFLNYSLVINVC